jgi:hypothetical protein
MASAFSFASCLSKKEAGMPLLLFEKSYVYQGNFQRKTFAGNTVLV